jgi:hypothetical protein
MILPKLILPSRVNQHWEFSGMDSIDRCADKQHFLSYPHNVTYDYNSRGFRDQEWPDTMQELRDAIWCIGDSFTVGLGSPIEHTWPVRLSKITTRRIINVSMDGASNEWIARITENIVQAIDPTQLVIMWSYTHRRENVNTGLSNELQRIHSSNCTDYNDWINFLDCKKRVDLITNSVQFAIPFFRPEQPMSITDDWAAIRGPDWPVNSPTTLQELNSLPNWILHELKNLHGQLSKFQTILPRLPPPVDLSVPNTVIPVKAQDLARDGHHFDLITAECVATQAKIRLG